MKVALVVVAASLLTSACAPKPAVYAENLSQTDPKFDSAECKEIRLKSLDYDDKVGGRIAIGVASGLLLGPFGIPIAMMADANQSEVRRTYSREVHLRCSSAPMPKSLEQSKPSTVKTEDK